MDRIQFAKVKWQPELEGKTLKYWCESKGLEPTLENGAELGYGFRIQPNPNNGIFNINFKNVTVNKIEAVDFLGRVVYSENVNTTKINSPKIMNLSHNAKGLYILKFYSDKGSWSHKIVIGN